MKKNVCLIVIVVLSFQSKLLAQDRNEAIQARKLAIKEKKSDNHTLNTDRTFILKVKAIEKTIEKIILKEKNALKVEVESVNDQLEKGLITQVKAEDLKIKLAETSAQNIERKVAVANQDLKNLIQEKVDGKLKENDSNKVVYFFFPEMKIKHKLEENKSGEGRTTIQNIFATGFNNLVTKGAVANSDFKYNRSSFMEFGLSFNTRIFKNNNIFHFKYGLTGVYNRLTASDNRYFVDNNGQTSLQTYPTKLRQRDTYFKNVFVTVPLFLELDFSKKQFDKNNNRIFKIQKGFRFGIGGFVGYNTNSKQFLSYEENGYRINERQKGNWNVPDWNYGLSTYFGYKAISLYLKYDLNPMFKNNIVKQNNISLGMRLDLN